MVRRLQFSALLCRVENLLQQIRSITQISHASSVWNFCARFSDLISRGNQCWCREMSAIFSGLEMPVPRALLTEYYLFLDTALEEQSSLRSQSKRQLPALVESRTRHLESLQSWAIIHQGYCLLYSRLLKEAAAHVDQVNQVVQFKKR